MEGVTSESSCHNGSSDSNNVGNYGPHPSILTGDGDGDFEILAKWRQETLLPIKDDLADWLGKTLGIQITADTFMSVLDNGVYLCQLAQLLQSQAEQAPQTPDVPKATVTAIKYHERAQSGTWFARDNIAIFLDWCQAWGVKAECMFETEGLVQHKEETSVALCLLQLARLGAKYGLEPPGLVRLEKEIEAEECQMNSVPEKIPVVQNQVVLDNNFKVLDIEVQRMAFLCRCPTGYQICRMSEGKYSIFGKIMFIRLLNGEHLMVRVGGGWDTLSHYLSTHDPCRIIRFPRREAPPMSQ